ncbi:MAG TPA: toll/interleukin-1 receptor domain-containing protein [Pseudonocardiaceae bacterium]|jgi:hypothetical protein|nr:toll/interleukin-1 receptor domain-containing protein [Pseudonocardiaceae bacterium]
MPDVFINFRTSDEPGAAALIERYLSTRFGTHKIFRDSKSIKAGENYIRALLTAVHDCQVLLAVIGPRWLSARDTQGRNALDNEGDWIRRELVEAFDHGVRVIPVLVGDKLNRLDRAELPPVLGRLADLQYRQLNIRNDEADLRKLGDDLAELVPSLTEGQQPEPAVRRSGTRNEIREVSGTALAAGDNAHQQSGGIGGNLHIISGNSGPIHSGSGHIFGDGTNYVAGNNTGGIHQGTDPRRDER